MKKLSWITTTVPWEQKKIIWLRGMKGDTPAQILKFIDFERGTSVIYKNMPTDPSTIRKVMKELDLMPKSMALRLIDEVPDMVDYFADKRPDLGIDRNNIPPVTRLVKKKTSVDTDS